MSERDRMLRGEPYNSRDEALLATAHRTRALLAAFAATSSLDGAKRRDILEQMLGGVGAEVWIEPPFFCDYGENIYIGARTFVNFSCVFLDSAEIRIGTDVLLGPGVQLLTPSHPLRAADRIVAADQRKLGESPYRTNALPISVGDRVWIGGGTIVLPGITIGNDAMIGAGSVVTSDIPANALAVGNPSRVLRSLD
jgi:maltose O-acetyltransferase